MAVLRLVALPPHLVVVAVLIAYHVTPRRNLGSIMRWGLIPRDPTHASDRNPGWGGKNRGVRAVFVTESLHGALRWSIHPFDRYHTVPLAVLELDVSGLPLEPDAYNPHVWSRVLARVEPARIGRAA